MTRVFIFSIVCFLSMTQIAFAKQNFDTWLAGFKKKAAQAGISQNTINSSLSDLSPNSRVVELDRNQPTKKWTFAKYQERIVSADRIQKGRRLYRTHRAELKKAEAKYGVPGEIIVALWGIESNFGSNTGGFDVIRSLATLAWDGRREKLFTEELLAALQIIDQGHITRKGMTGSWAGAMGQSQFMPSSFLNLAQDGNGDGKRDIWTTKADVFASAANYLKTNGWKPDYRWGRRVTVPKKFSKPLVGTDIKKPLSYWQSKGVRLPGGKDLPEDKSVQASLVAPDGLDGPTYLAYNNYRVLLRWNRSTYFATSVGLLADAIAQ